jgi:chromosome segregation ATPase
VEALELELKRREVALREREMELRRLDQTLRAEIDALRADADEKRALLQNRNEQLIRVKSELDRLHQRAAELENAAREETAAAIANERMRDELKGQVAVLQSQLAQREFELATRQATVDGLENLSAQAGEVSIQHELTITEAQKARLKGLQEMLDAAKADAEQTFSGARSRRWRLGRGEKRRWKSSGR